ncbi:site-specific integrase [Rhodoblastus acidophilus]|uniref:Site-specific integrase n=1 Tax=Candidatus Rhodoblastus alkanivorans TaxID=2954117 RepID=A0ABS9Z3I7_9HYPH|nr:site-specific integrase [Candidatus Rhodoblastus alkanivorans]MCI4680513.1 site-specific integrase [Candidatus Rhodoblastus alkanivorans]MCI4682239.1 site-specific integrase [Candidatus Rhodoblastus alkanivorans]MDI4639541.1 site-specific integrase [Rhodoblastus acidophilus]
MTTLNGKPNTLADVLAIVAEAGLTASRKRDLISAINRLCEMAGRTPSDMPAEASALRAELRKILPARFGVSAKTFSNQRSLLAAALRQAGALDDMGRGFARRHPSWGPLMQAVGADTQLDDGLAAFANWCARSGISPDEVTDESMKLFAIWLETRTHCLKPRDVVRRTPLLWNRAGATIDGWPKTRLSPVSFRGPRRRLAWDDLSESFRRDAEAYLGKRAAPDIFHEEAAAPRRPLAPNTLRQQREHLRLAASVLVEVGMAVADVASLADLVERERFKTILRHYHGQQNGKPNAFAVALAKTLVQVAKHHVGASAEQVADLKALAAKLPPVPFDLTPKNKALLRQLESDGPRAGLLFLPETLLAKVASEMEAPRLPFVEGQVAIAIDIQLACPLRPQNLSNLHWRRHFLEPDGPKGRLLLHIPAEETKTKRQDLTVEIPEDVARRLRWYRRHMLPRVGGDPNGFLFVTKNGDPKSQETLTQQIIETIARHVGVHMTPHQFRHFVATIYLDANPEDHQTAQAILHHASAKTTLIYAGSASRRASRAYGKILFEQREQLELARRGKKAGPRRAIN